MSAERTYLGGPPLARFAKSPEKEDALEGVSAALDDVASGRYGPEAQARALDARRELTAERERFARCVACGNVGPWVDVKDTAWVHMGARQGAECVKCGQRVMGSESGDPDGLYVEFFDSAEEGRAGRCYSQAEVDSIRAAYEHFWGHGVGDPRNSGVAQYATGPYWPDKMEQEASRLTALAADLVVAAKAIRREQASEACPPPAPRSALVSTPEGREATESEGDHAR